MLDFSLLEPYYALCAVCFISLYFIVHRLRRKDSLPLPPGPRKLPLLGNVLDIPSSFEWETFHQWSKDYHSDVVHLKVIETSIIILNSVKAVKDLLEKRSLHYSNRPKFTLITEVMGFSWLFPFLPYGAAWKERRRLFQRHCRPTDDAFHKPLGLHYSRILLSQLLESPESYMTHVKNANGAFLLSLSYGMKINPSNSEVLRRAESIGGYLADSSTPLAMLFDQMPFLISFFSRFLSMPALRMPRNEWEKIITEFRDTPFHDAKRLMADGMADPSFVVKCLEELSTSADTGQQEEVIKDVAAMVFVGGSGTTSAIHTFFLAMTLFPEAQARAHEELDRVVGTNRLPDFDDELHLPFISALLKEVHRWNPSAPLGVPRFLEKDDEYNGYFLPGQSIVIANAWSILHDEDEYPEPSVFMPERFLKDGFLNPKIGDPAAILFGVGRRSCPGMHIAQSTLWIMIASILSVFEISPPVDERGIEILPSGEYHSTMTLQPLPFQCSIKPRHAMAEVLIRECVEL